MQNENNIHKTAGFTIIELMIAIALLAVVLVIGVPSFTSTIERNNLATKNNILVSDLSIARSEAIKRGQSITLCKSIDGINCSTDASVGYENGWIIFAEQPVTVHALGSRDVANEELLRVQNALNDSYTLRGNDRFVNFISYFSSGEIANTDPDNDLDHVVLCRDNDISKSRAVFITSTGRIHLARDSDSNGIPEDDNGNSLTTCTPS